MRVISCSLTNFASYKKLDFTFTEQGLALIQGPTGAGKSTLCDAVPWVLFGRTAKDGAVDEVRSWNAEGGTTGTLYVESKGAVHMIYRSRSPSDLYIRTSGLEVQRGKDLNDTQKLINNLLGFDVNTYLAGAYFHEFSQTAQFFTTTAKNRRATIEQMVDLSLAKTLQTNIADQVKALTKGQQKYANDIRLYADRIQQLEKQDYKSKAESFEADQEKTIKALQLKIQENRKGAYIATDQLKLRVEIEQLSALLHDARCAECGAPKDLELRELIRNTKDELSRVIRATDDQLKIEQSTMLRILEERKRENNFMQLEEKRVEDLSRAICDLDLAEKSLAKTQGDIEDLELLQDVVNDFRGATIQNTIHQLEQETNGLLSKHFDAEIRVLFTSSEADKIEVEIFKDGNAASYAQMSKGQRQLLRLSFAVSVMRQVANHAGTSFNCLFFDEALSGLDESMKDKAFGLFQQLSLETESVFVIDHSEGFKTLFTKRYDVSLVNGSSTIEEA